MLLALISGNIFGQATKEKMDQIKKDPKTIENAAKADAGLVNNKKIVDSTFKITAIKKKRVGCRCARKQKNTSGSK